MSDKKAAAFLQNHPNTDLDDFRTPNWLLAFIHMHWGINYDAACTPGLNEVVEKTLRLEETWPVKRWPISIFSNPPWDTKSIIKWINKGHEWVHAPQKRKIKSQRTHIMLIPNKLTVVELQESCEYLSKYDLIFLGGRINFEGPNIAPGGSSRTGCLLLIQRNHSKYGLMGVRYIPIKKLKSVFRYAEKGKYRNFGRTWGDIRRVYDERI